MDSPFTHITPEANDKPKSPNKHRSLPIAPMSRPVGPELEYPHEYIILKTARANPMAAAAMEKYKPAMKSMTKVEGAISTKL